MKTILAILILTSAIATEGRSQSLLRGENLMFNGRFDHPDGPLTGWTYDYSAVSGHSARNHERVAFLPREGVRHNVLRLDSDQLVDTKVDGPPIAVEPGARYRLSMMAKSTAPRVRIILEGYHWRPGIRPHDGIPTLTELRRSFKTKPVYFGSTRDGEFSNPTTQWSRGVREFPDRDMTPLAQRNWNRVEFVVLHVVIINGDQNRALFISDIELERIE